MQWYHVKMNLPINSGTWAAVDWLFVTSIYELPSVPQMLGNLLERDLGTWLLLVFHGLGGVKITPVWV